MIVGEGSGTLRLLDYLGPPAGGWEVTTVRWGVGKGSFCPPKRKGPGAFRLFPCFSNKPCVLQRGAKEVQDQGKKGNGMGGPGSTFASHASPASSGTGSQATPAGWEGSSENQK